MQHAVFKSRVTECEEEPGNWYLEVFRHVGDLHCPEAGITQLTRGNVADADCEQRRNIINGQVRQ